MRSTPTTPGGVEVKVRKGVYEAIARKGLCEVSWVSGTWRVRITQAGRATLAEGEDA